MDWLVKLALILILAKLAGSVFRKFGQAGVLGELLVGLFLGSIFIFPENLEEMSELGVILLMFLAGLETDIKLLSETKRSSLYAAIGGMLLPFLCGFSLGITFNYSMIESIFFGCVLTATSVSISAQTLIELGKLHSKEGATILGAAVIDDILGIFCLAFAVGFATGELTTTSLILLILKITLFFSCGVILGIKLLPIFLRKLKRLKIIEPIIGGALVIILFYAYLAAEAGLATIIGAYIAGVILSKTDYKEELDKKLHTITYAIFAPLFFVSIGFKCQLKAQLTYFFENLYFILLITIGAILGKLIGCTLGAKKGNLSWKSSVCVGCGMISRGEVALIIAALGLKLGIVNQPEFTVMIIMTIVTTFITPFLLKFSFKMIK